MALVVLVALVALVLVALVALVLLALPSGTMNELLLLPDPGFGQRLRFCCGVCTPGLAAWPLRGTFSESPSSASHALPL